LSGQILKLVLKPAKEPEAQNPQKSAVLRILGVGYEALVLNSRSSSVSVA